MKAISVSVCRSIYADSTNGGISSRFNDLWVICDEGWREIDEKKPPENLVKVVKREICGRTIYHLEPYESPEYIGWMMGGNYAASSDSRFSALVGGMYGAVAIHDRQETPELYDMLSR